MMDIVDDRALLAGIGWGVALSIVVTAGAHRFLTRRLEARGITPWRLRDTIGATPLITLGAFLAGLGASLGATVVQRLITASANQPAPTALLITIPLLLLLATLLMALGVHALTKLFR